MKNRHYEQSRRFARQYAMSHPLRLNRYGVRAYHSYEGLDPGRMAWWDDFAFILNSYHVCVAWIHPRMAYEDRISEAAMSAVDSLWVDDERMKIGATQYRRVGRSRKKLISHDISFSDNHEYFDALSREEQRLSVESNVQVRPYIKPKWTRYHRFVSLCVPVEVRSEADLGMLARLTKRLLKHETTLETEFPGYVYSKEDWVREGLAGAGGSSLHVHRVAGT